MRQPARRSARWRSRCTRGPAGCTTHSTARAPLAVADAQVDRPLAHRVVRPGGDAEADQLVGHRRDPRVAGPVGAAGVRRVLGVGQELAEQAADGLVDRRDDHAAAPGPARSSR